MRGERFGEVTEVHFIYRVNEKWKTESGKWKKTDFIPRRKSLSLSEFQILDIPPGYERIL